MHDGPRPGMDEHEGFDQRKEMPRMDHGMLTLGTWKSKSTWVMKIVFTRVKARVEPVKVRHHEHLVDWAIDATGRVGAAAVAVRWGESAGMAHRLRHGTARRGRSSDTGGLAQPCVPAGRWRRSHLRRGRGREEEGKRTAVTARCVGWGSGLRCLWIFLYISDEQVCFLNPLTFHGCICVC